MSDVKDINVNQLAEEFKINGFIVIEDFIPIDILDRIYKAWLPIRDREIERLMGISNRGLKRYAIDIPLERPFIEPKIFDHITLVKLFESILGKDYIFQDYSSITPFPGAVYQQWHRDLEPLFPGMMTPTIRVALHIPLVDTTEENGSIEVIPSSHYIADKELCRGKWFDHVLGKGPKHIGNYHSIRLNVKRGSIWLLDLRLLHRGMPNVSNSSRDGLIMHFSRPWFYSGRPLKHMEDTISRELWNSFSDHAQKVLRG